MPFCPKCRYEYRPDIKMCPDCDEKLLDELPEEKPNQPAELVCVASFMFEPPAQEAKLRLHSEGIESVLSNEVMSQIHTFVVWADGGVKLLVRKEDAARAAKVLEQK